MLILSTRDLTGAALLVAWAPSLFAAPTLEVRPLPDGFFIAAAPDSRTPPGVRVVTVAAAAGPALLSVYFSSGDAAVDPAYRSRVGAVAAQGAVTVVGYADETGSRDRNAALAARRAQALARLIVAAGGSVSLIRTGEGDRCPRLSPDCLARARRAEVLAR